MSSTDEKQNKRLIRIILISWFLVLLIGIVIVTYATVEISKIKQSQSELANRPPQIVKEIETRLQPVYTTIEGTKGDRGDKGNNAISTHTEVTTVIKTETAIPGPTGRTGRTGTSGTDGREIEVAQDENGKWYQRYSGDEAWNPVTIITGILP